MAESPIAADPEAPGPGATAGRAAGPRTTRSAASDGTLPRPIPTTMRAVVQAAYGSPEVLRTSTVPVPVPGTEEVLVRVAAAGVDSGTWHLMYGKPYLARLAFGIRRPKRQVPGLDLAGTVVAVGERVTDLAVGDEVVGIGRGSFAEYAVAPVRKLARRPTGIEPRAAAAVPVSGLTALQALRDAGRVAAGSRVLVIGASGGVGSYAVQIAVAFGAEVTGVCSAAKADAVRRWGATQVVDRAVPMWWLPMIGRGDRFDAVIDIAGRLPARVLRSLTTPTGSLVFVGGEGGGPLTGGMGRQVRGVLRGLVSRQKVTMLVAREDGRDVAELCELIADGLVVPAVDRVMPLDGVADALWAIERGQVCGKLVIEI